MTALPLIGKLDAPSEENFTQALAYIQQLLKEGHPGKNFNTGSTLYWLAAVPNAQAAAVHLENVDLMLANQYLDSLRNGAITDDSLADLLLSNYYITRGESTKSSGNITVVVSAQANYTVTAGTAFTSGGYTYVTNQTYYIYRDAARVSRANDRLLTARADGNYQYTLPVEAESAGSSSYQRQGTSFDMASAPPEVVFVVASSDIDGGTDVLDNAELVSRIPETLAAQTVGGRNSIASLIEANFPNTRTAVTGMGDALMHRDTHNREGISSGGMVDVWVSTQDAAGVTTLEVEATLISVADKQWSFDVPESEAPGIYTVIGIRPQGSTGNYSTDFTITRGYQTPVTGYTPIIANGSEAAFSAYQSLGVVFTDTTTVHATLANGATRAYEVVVQKMPLIKEVSDFLTSANRVDPATNILVRAAVPCILDISVVIRLLDSDFEDDIDTVGIRADIVRRVANTATGYGVLSVSLIMDAVHNYLNGRSDVGGMSTSLAATIVAPTGDVLSFFSPQEIVVPERPDLGLGRRNTAFMTSTDRITIAFERVDA